MINSRSPSIVHISPKKSSPAAPISLNLTPHKPTLLSRKSIPSLETNLHKILARKFLDSEEVSFRKVIVLLADLPVYLTIDIVFMHTQKRSSFIYLGC